jgi:phosphatidylethanolamine/phosphatidyl-N-methylethanolamine N-methyltransferase
MDATEKVKRRYDRNSRFYELYESPMERMMFGGLRRKFFEKINADNHKTILEVGVGTGKNLPYYTGQRVTGIDISDKMLEKARIKNRRLKKEADLRIGDAQALPFADGSFDAALATFVFCSVPDPVKGLHEVKRVVKNGGKIYLMEHVRPTRSRLLGVLFDLLDPVFSRLTGAHINRKTVSNLEKAGFKVINRYEGPGGILQMIEAVPNKKERTP